MSQHNFKTTNIKGKEYVMIHERIKFFRSESKYSGWAIVTDFSMLDADMCVCVCRIYDAGGQVISMGHAYEERSSSMINKTSYVENCETSAIGRALGFMGIGVDTSIASAEEVETALRKQDMIEKIQKTFDTEPPKDIMKLAINHIKSSKDKKKAFESIMSKYGESLTDNQVDAIKKFVS